MDPIPHAHALSTAHWSNVEHIKYFYMKTHHMGFLYKPDIVNNV